MTQYGTRSLEMLRHYFKDQPDMFAKVDSGDLVEMIIRVEKRDKYAEIVLRSSDGTLSENLPQSYEKIASFLLDIP